MAIKDYQEEIKRIVSNLDIENEELKEKILIYLSKIKEKGIDPSTDILFTIPELVENKFILNKVINLSSSRKKGKSFFEIIETDKEGWSLSNLRIVPFRGLEKRRLLKEKITATITEKENINNLKDEISKLSKKINDIEGIQTKQISEINKLKEIIFDIINNNSFEEKIQFIPIDIYLDTDDPHKIFNVYKSIIDFIKILGFEERIELDAKKGSWIKKIIAKSKRVMSDKEVTDRLKEVEYALEVKILKEQSEIDKNQSEALSNILTSLKDIPNAAIKIGSLLVVKITNDGTASVQVRSLSILELHFLNKNPDLLLKPNEILKTLANVNNDNNGNNNTIN